MLLAWSTATAETPLPTVTTDRLAPQPLWTVPLQVLPSITVTVLPLGWSKLGFPRSAA